MCSSEKVRHFRGKTFLPRRRDLSELHGAMTRNPTLHSPGREELLVTEIISNKDDGIQHGRPINCR
jgi:hypothetical protein